MDSQNVKWGNNKAPNDIDGNKKLKGIQRHFLVDKNGFLITVLVTVANMYDLKAEILLVLVINYLYSYIKLITADGGYRGQLAGNIRNTFGYVL